MTIDILPLNMQNKIAVNGDCWDWTGAINNRGYGSVTNGNGGSMLAHRKAYEHAVGLIQGDLTIDHLCRNKRCVNPAHMEPVTRAENIRRKAEAQTHCRYGHELAGDNLRFHKRGDRVQRECRLCAMDTQRACRMRKAGTLRSKARPTYDALLEATGAVA